MAYTITVVKETVMGDLKTIIGTYTKASGDTTGTFTLGIQGVLWTEAHSNTAAVVSSCSWSSGTLTFYGASGDTGGYWMVQGY
jgi:hypothetical protein